MYRALMIPTDGSDLSRHAIPLALAVAVPANAVVRIVGVFEAHAAPIYGVPIANAGLTGGTLLIDPESVEPALTAQREEQTAALRDIARRLSETGGVTTEASLEDGTVIDALRRYAATHHVDLIVMATHGRGGIGRAVLGSVADALIRAAPCPVLLARPHGEVPNDAVPAVVRHVLVPLDGSREGDVVVEHAATVAALTRARCTLLHISRVELLPGIAAPEPLVDPDAARDADTTERIHLERAADAFRARSVPVATVVLRGGSIHDAIIEYASTHAVDFIAMATHGRSGLERLMLGSVATALLRRTQLPLLLVRMAA